MFFNIRTKKATISDPLLPLLHSPPELVDNPGGAKRVKKQESSCKDNMWEPMFCLCRRSGRQSKLLSIDLYHLGVFQLKWNIVIKK